MYSLLWSSAGGCCEPIVLLPGLDLNFKFLPQCAATSDSSHSGLYGGDDDNDDLSPRLDRQTDPGDALEFKLFSGRVDITMHKCTIDVSRPVWLPV